MARIREDDLRRAHEIAARLVTEYGDRFLPIFERVEREIDALDERKDAMQRALDVAQRAGS